MQINFKEKIKQYRQKRQSSSNLDGKLNLKHKLQKIDAQKHQQQDAFETKINYVQENEPIVVSKPEAPEVSKVINENIIITPPISNSSNETKPNLNPKASEEKKPNDINEVKELKQEPNLNPKTLKQEKPNDINEVKELKQEPKSTPNLTKATKKKTVKPKVSKPLSEEPKPIKTQRSIKMKSESASKKASTTRNEQHYVLQKSKSGFGWELRRPGASRATYVGKTKKEVMDYFKTQLKRSSGKILQEKSKTGKFLHIHKARK